MSVVIQTGGRKVPQNFRSIVNMQQAPTTAAAAVSSTSKDLEFATLYRGVAFSESASPGGAHCASRLAAVSADTAFAATGNKVHIINVRSARLFAMQRHTALTSTTPHRLWHQHQNHCQRMQCAPTASRHSCPCRCRCLASQPARLAPTHRPSRCSL